MQGSPTIARYVWAASTPLNIPSRSASPRMRPKSAETVSFIIVSYATAGEISSCPHIGPDLNLQKCIHEKTGRDFLFLLKSWSSLLTSWMMHSSMKLSDFVTLDIE